MNYQHSYHAGGFSDVLKHITLITLIEGMHRKEKPLCYLDTHAGRGLYYLQSESAKKTGEFEIGIQKLFEYFHATADKKSIPKIIETYLNTAQQLGYPNYYPGSPLIAQRFLKTSDRLVLMELHPEEHRILQKNMQGDHRAATHKQDGYLGFKAFLPPPERRGLILIDPPFEKPDEWKQLLAGLKVGLKQFPTGVFAVWYPIKDLRAVKQFMNGVAKLDLSNKLIAEFTVYPPDAPLGLMGSGMLIINPPFQTDVALKETLPWLWQALAVNGAGGWRVF